MCGALAGLFAGPFLVAQDLDPLPQDARLRVSIGRAINGLAFSPDGASLLAAGDLGLLTLRDVATGKELASFPGNQSLVLSCAFSPDGKVLARGR